ncbi:ribonuclease P/MRP protein subunit POP3 [Geosmithia morbida]|uniref:Ribonuclease P/MRP protein subunit POP3 n=1 Tax=Geosmithia morbida TaxID=1094350 RepID=A0A9P4YYB0_9HYPO|nr:ribonuclease P/MRP protein subunit POP3 [Geosmithia morbida]KAF4123224.1 ribonuclease P/MRP protein subunit POP3 [Geosmithia morbida]
MSAPRKRTVHQLDTPYSTDLWPEITLEDQETILELLCSFLSPLGHHRRTHVIPSKGKKASRQKRRQQRDGEKDDAAVAPSPPAAPDVIHSVDVGFNAISRNLQLQSEVGDSKSKQRKDRCYAMVFVARGDQSSVFNCHFPRMVAAAASSGNAGGKAGTRLVGFSKSCSDRLSKCLHIPRVSSVAVAVDAPGATALLETVNRIVRPLDGIDLLNGQQRQPQYIPTKINAIETTVGQKKQKKAA